MSRAGAPNRSHAPQRDQADLSWQNHARCLRIHADFFPEKPGRDNAIEAKRVCRTCPVKDACLEHALINRELGVWGGLTEREREDMIAARRRNDRWLKREVVNA